MTDTLNAPALPADAIFVPGCVAGVTREQIAALRGKALSRLDYGRGRHVQIDGSTLLDLLTIAEAIPALAARISAPAAPAGWKLVPIEPTDAMLDVGHEAIKDRHERNCGQWGECGGNSRDEARAGWSEMLSAAPVSPNAASGEQS